MIMEDAYEYLSSFIATLYGVLDPALFVLSGSVALKIPGFIEEIEKRAKEKKFWSYAGPALIILIILGLIIASVLDSKRLSSKDTSTDSVSASSASAETESTSQTSSDTAYQTDTSLSVKDGDKINIDYVGSVDGVEFEGGNDKGKRRRLTIGSHTYIDDFEEQLIGHHPGEEVDVTVTFPDDYREESLAGKEALFKVTINGIYE